MRKRSIARESITEMPSTYEITDKKIAAGSVRSVEIDDLSIGEIQNVEGYVPVAPHT